MHHEAHGAGGTRTTARRRDPLRHPTARKYVLGEPLRDSVRQRLAEAEARLRGKRARG